MARRALNERNIRKLTRMGSKGISMGITLPIEMLRGLRWRERQKIQVRRSGKKLILEDWEE